MGKILLKPYPDWYLLGVHLKFPDEHTRPLYMGAPPPKCTGFISFGQGQNLELMKVFSRPVELVPDLSE